RLRVSNRGRRSRVPLRADRGRHAVRMRGEARDALTVGTVGRVGTRTLRETVREQILQLVTNLARSDTSVRHIERVATLTRSFQLTPVHHEVLRDHGNGNHVALVRRTIANRVRVAVERNVRSVEIFRTLRNTQ